jgi:hypothetical protein
MAWILLLLQKEETHTSDAEHDKYDPAALADEFKSEILWVLTSLNETCTSDHIGGSVGSSALPATRIAGTGERITRGKAQTSTVDTAVDEEGTAPTLGTKKRKADNATVADRRGKKKKTA